MSSSSVQLSVSVIISRRYLCFRTSALKCWSGLRELECLRGHVSGGDGDGEILRAAHARAQKILGIFCAPMVAWDDSEGTPCSPLRCAVLCNAFSPFVRGVGGGYGGGERGGGTGEDMASFSKTSGGEGSVSATKPSPRLSFADAVRRSSRSRNNATATMRLSLSDIVNTHVRRLMVAHFSFSPRPKVN